MRFVAVTHNLWGNHRWPERRPALAAFLRCRTPDIYAVQELLPTMGKVIDAELRNHDRVEGDDAFGGCEQGNSIWWDGNLFERVDHGTSEISPKGRIHPPVPPMFWVRLNGRSTGTALTVATVHFSYPGNSQEVSDHINPRITQAEAALSALNRIAADSEPCLLMGDLNEAWHTLRVLHAGGLVDSFTALRAIPPPTCPVIPTRWADPRAHRTIGHHAPRVIDFQLHRGPLRPLMYEVVDFFENDLAPSDHKPVATAYAFT